MIHIVIYDVLFPWERNGWTKQNIIVCSSGVDSTTFTTQMSSQQVVKEWGECPQMWETTTSIGDIRCN